MQYLTMASSHGDVHVSKLVIGTARFGDTISEDLAFSLLDAFVAAGGNCIDTARAYAQGRSEQLVGRWIRSRGNRESIVLSTKGCHPAGDIRRLSECDMRDDLSRSLEALQTDHIDVYWLHKDDPDRSVEEIVDNMNAAIVSSGAVRLIGCSNWHVDRIASANEYAAATGQQGFAASQIQWSLAHTHEEYFVKYGAVVMSDQEYKWYKQQCIPVFAFGSQARGFFSKVASNGLESLSAETRAHYASDENLLRVIRTQDYASAHNISISATALGYITCNELPSVAVFACSNLEQLADSLNAADIVMSPNEVDALYLV